MQFQERIVGKASDHTESSDTKFPRLIWMEIVEWMQMHVDVL